MNNNDKTLVEKPNLETRLAKTPRFATDINFARFPIFGSKGVRGYRTLPSIIEEVGGVKITRTVSVGTYRDTNQTLDTDDELVFKAIYGRWEKKGCNMNDRRVVTALMSTVGSNLLSGPTQNKQRRPGERDYQKIRRSLDKLARISIEYDQAYESNMGYRTETIHCLNSAEVFNRKETWGSEDGRKSGNKGGKFFEFTELELNEKICQNIKDKKIKLFYLDQLAAIRSEAGRLIYDHLELLGSVIKSPFRREALEFAKERTIHLGPDGRVLSPKRIIEKIRRACLELKGKLLTSGIIGRCYVEIEKGKWFFICHINKVITTRPKKTKGGMVHVVTDRSDLEQAAENLKNKELFEAYEALPPEEKEKIDHRINEIHSTIYHGMGKKVIATLRAMEEHLGISNLHNDVEELKEINPEKLTIREVTLPENQIRPSPGSPAAVAIQDLLSALETVALTRFYDEI